MEFYREGILNKAGKGLIQTHLHSWRPRYFVLNGLQLKYFKNKEQSVENMLGCIEISEIESVSLMKNEHKAFQITTKSPKSRTYYMSGRNEDEIQGWIKCLTMAQTKYREKEMNNDKIPSVYDEINLPSVNPNPPEKPARSYIVSGSGFLDSSQFSDNLVSPTLSGAQPVFSQYGVIGAPDKQATGKIKKDEKFEQDPTYDTINDNVVPKNEIKEQSSEQVTTQVYDEVSPVTKSETIISSDFYDTVTSVTSRKSPTKNITRASDPLPRAAGPPPLPARLPSMSDEISDASTTVEIDGKVIPRDLYEVVSQIPPIQENSESEESQTTVVGLCDEVSDPSNHVKTPQDEEYNSVDLYDEVTDPSAPVPIEIEKVEHENEPSPKDPLHVYAKPDKKKTTEKSLEIPLPIYSKVNKDRSISRGQSKRKLIPGLMDVGEVEDNVEQEAAAGRERLERGMTKPMGERFAIEDLREILAEYDLETNNNESEALVDFDLNQSESAFDVLRQFLATYE